MRVTQLLTSAFLILALPLAATAADVSGVVLDPQGLAVPSARVELVCGRSRRAVKTDNEGRFAVAQAAPADCTVSVSKSGFAPFNRQVPTGDNVSPLVIQLQIADISERVDVVTSLPPRSLSSVSLSADDFRTMAADSSELVRYARLLAGTTFGGTALYVDGLPSNGLPPIDLIERISVNADRFSAEHTDGDTTSIRIITRAPARTLRFQSGSDLLGTGGRDMLAPGARAQSMFGSFGVRGPLPRLPITFAAALQFGRSTKDVSVPGSSASTTNHNGTGTLDAYYSPASAIKAHVAYHESQAQGTNLGVGGLTLPEAGLSSSYISRDVRATMTDTATVFLYEGGLAMTRTSSSSRANTVTPGVSVLGAFVTGGSPVTGADSTRIRWTSSHTVRSTASRPWTAGVVVSGSDDAIVQTPNEGGAFQYPDLNAYTNALSGAGTGTWFVTRGSGAVQYAGLTVSPFLQKELLSSERFALSAGIRADYQRGFGTIAAPRVSLAARLAGATVRAGAGLFVRNLPSDIFIRAIQNDGQHFQQFIATNVSPVVVSSDEAARVSGVTSRLADDLARPTQFMGQVSVDWRVRGLTPEIDYTFTRDRRLLGSDRVANVAGWTDLVESNRAAERHRVHFGLDAAWKHQRVAAHYEWIHARDNTDGAASFPERQGNFAAEWARSAGTAPHNVAVLGTLTLPASMSVTVSDVWRSSAPYNVTTGLDLVGDGLNNDRGGRPRNSGDGPAYHSMAFYAYRRISLPPLGPARTRWYAHVGVQADNLLDERNVMTIGSVIGSSTFGQPLAAFPGRSVRLFINFD